MAITNIRQFKAALKKKDVEIRVATAKCAVQIVRRLFTKIKAKTPVGNPDLWNPPIRPPGYEGGNLKGNWRVGLNNRPTDEIPRDVAIAGKDEIEVHLAKLARFTVGDTVNITNNVVYAKKIEFGGGSPKQAPFGMALVSIEEIRAEFGG
jgi:hypothetical protein